MNHELNPGDRFMLEFEVKETTRSKEALRATTGDGKEYFFYAGTLQHAKPMRPAVPEPRIPEIKVGQKWVTRGIRVGSISASLNQEIMGNGNILKALLSLQTTMDGNLPYRDAQNEISSMVPR